MNLQVLCRATRMAARGLLGVNSARLSSTSSNLIVTTDEKTGVATMKLNRKPVNSLNLEFLTDICITLEKLDTSAKGIILTSAVPVFSAGLDITEMYQPQEGRVGEFWRMVQEMWLRLYGAQIPVIAAINGHSPAGGCLMALSCDYRIMAEGKYTIGLNETLLGIVAPFWFKDTMVNTIGHRHTERALQLGHLFGTEEALKVGVVDEVVPQEQVLQRAEEVMKTWLRIPAGARTITKSMLRQPTIEKLQQNRQSDVDNFINFVTKSSTQKMLGFYLENLRKKG